MRIFRSIGFTLAMALGSLVSISAHAVEHVVLRPLGILFTESANTMAKFKADLAAMQAGQSETAKVDSSLQREGNGFRQAAVFFPGNKLTIRVGLTSHGHFVVA